jgi:hypothetical protein
MSEDRMGQSRDGGIEDEVDARGEKERGKVCPNALTPGCLAKDENGDVCA